MLARKQELRQVGALPLLVNDDGGVEVVLVTARGSGRWIIPKGNPIRGLAPHEVAAREALEEAGLVGHVGKRCIGTFKFDRMRNGRDTTCRVDVYALKVERQMQIWTELHERAVLRCNVKTALSLVSMPNLATLINRYVMAHV